MMVNPYDYDSEDQEDEDSPRAAHPPLSPATGAESLFLAGLATSRISANALAYELRKSSYSSDRSMFSVATDDFVSAVGNSDDFSISPSSDDDYYSQPIPEIDSDSDDETMVKKSTQPTSTIPATPVKESHPDAAAHVYEGAKGVWSWGKGLPVVSIGFGVTEALAGKVAEVAGTNLKDLDGALKPKLVDFDAGVLNPAIEKFVGVVLNAAGKTEDIIKPIVVSVLSPFGLIEAEKK